MTEDSSPASGAARPSRRLLESTFEFARDGMVITEAQLDEPGPRIVAVNPAFEQMTGYQREEVIGLTPRILQGARTDRQVVGGIRQTLKAGAVFRGETYNYRKSGEEFVMSWYIAPIVGGDGKVTNYLGVQRDVTEERRLEALARTVDRMDHLGHVFAGIRHELGNPVNNMMSVLRLLRDHFNDLSQDKVQAYLNDVFGETERMASLLDDLRSFSLQEKPCVEPVSLQPILKRTVNMASVGAQEAGIDLVLSVSKATVGREVEGDSRALHQVLLNLLNNAIDALDGCPEASIRVEARATRQFAVIKLIDSGAGMSEAQMQELFRPFHTSKVNGTGLGLVISRKLMTEMGGSLDVESIQGRGTTATLKLVWATPANVAAGLS